MNQTVIKINGVSYPLCLTVSAVDEVTEACGDLSKLPDYICGNGTKALCDRTIWLLELMAREGRARLQSNAEVGETPVFADLPSADVLSHMWDVADVKEVYGTLMAAVAASLKRNIEAEATEKN